MSVSKLLLLPLLLSSLLSGCAQKAPDEDIDDSSVTETAARRFSDGFVNDLLKNRKGEMYGKFDGTLQEVLHAKTLDAALDRLVASVGRPLGCIYLTMETGEKTAAAGKRPLRTFWYSARTTKYPRGQYLFIEVVSDHGEPKTTGFWITTLPERLRGKDDRPQKISARR
jgi:hypothetical protein